MGSFGRNVAIVKLLLPSLHPACFYRHCFRMHTHIHTHVHTHTCIHTPPQCHSQMEATFVGPKGTYVNVTIPEPATSPTRTPAPTTTASRTPPVSPSPHRAPDATVSRPPLVVPVATRSAQPSTSSGSFVGAQGETAPRTSGAVFSGGTLGLAVAGFSLLGLALVVLGVVWVRGYRRSKRVQDAVAPQRRARATLVQVMPQQQWEQQADSKPVRA
jgi:hypothetical protein